MTLKARLTFGIKNLVNHLQLNYSPRIRQAFNAAHVLVAATGYSKQVILEKFGKQAHHLPETWLVDASPELRQQNVENNTPLRLVWSGTHDHRKNLRLCLQALSMVSNKNWALDILGTGNLTGRLKKMTEHLGIAANITWHGHIPRQQAIEVMAGANLHIITSIAEDNPNVLTEAMSYGVPTLTLNHYGMADGVCSHCGVKIDINDNGAMTRSIAQAIQNLIENRHLLVAMVRHTVSCAQKHHWQKRLRVLDQIYDEAIAIHARQTQKNVPTGLIVA